jgi:predicted permease
MGIWGRLISWLPWNRRRQREADLERELRDHLELEAEEQQEAGMSSEEAVYAARRALGNTTRIKEDVRAAWGFQWLETLLQDLRYGLRQLRRNPGFTMVAVLTLALGIGATTAIFSVVNAVLLRPLPYPDSSRLVWITEQAFLKTRVAGGADYVAWKRQNTTLEGITAYDESASFNLTGRGTPARVQGAQVDANFFLTLHVQPDLGRSFSRQEDQPNGPHVVVLMHSFWQQYFGSDPHVIGQTVTLDSTPYTIIGVMPANFKFPGNSDLQFLVPLQLNEVKQLQRQMIRIVHIIGRMRPGVSVARVTNELDAIRKRAESAAPKRAFGNNRATLPIPGGAPGPGTEMMKRFRASRGLPSVGPGMKPLTAPAHELPEGSPSNPPLSGNGAPPLRPSQEVATGGSRKGSLKAGEKSHGAELRATPRLPNSNPLQRRSFHLPETEVQVMPLAQHLAGNLRRAMLIMFGVVGFVLLIACANVANLMLARSSSRSQEVAVRTAMGAGRWRLARQLLTESVLLSSAGGVAGLLISAWGIHVLTRLIPSSIGSAILSLEPPQEDAAVLLFALAVSVTTGILFGLVPGLAATRPNLVEQLKESGQATNTGGGRGWLGSSLVVGELSLALVVLMGAGLLMKSFYRLTSVNLGFAPEHVLTMNFNLPDSRYPRPEQKLAFFSGVLRRVESLPGVRSAVLADSLPLSPYRVRLMITPWLANPPRNLADLNLVQVSRIAVSPSYFYALGIPVLEGRTFTDRDNAGAQYVAVVNDALGRRLFPGEDPVGRDLPRPGSFNIKMTIVGVVGNIHHEGPGASVQSEIYVPYLQSSANYMQLAVRSAVDPASLAGAVRREVAAVDPDQPTADVTTLEQTLSQSVAPRRFNMLLLGVFAFIALLISTVGVYGVVAYSVTQRTHEVGIRMALGAQRGDVLRMVIGQGLKLALIGVAIGVAGALALTRFLASLLYGVKPTDPLTFIAVSVILIAVALLACYIPARRASKIDPMVALRYE